MARPTAASGTVNVPIPAELTEGTYTLKLFSEQYNGDYKTDLASAFSNVVLTVKPVVTLNRVDFTSLTTTLTPGEIVSADGVLESGQHYSLFDQKWVLQGGGPDAYTGNAVPGNTYFYWGWIEPDEGYTFGDVGTKVPVYLNGTKIGEGTVEMIAGSPMVDFDLDCTLPVENITTASVTVMPPTAGAAVYAAGQPAPGSHFTIAEQYCCSSASASSKITGGLFQQKTKYYYYALLKPDEGYTFPNQIPVNADANGTPASTKHTYTGTVGGEDRTGWFYMFVPLTTETETYTGDIVLTGFVEPVAGAAVVSNIEAADMRWSYFVESQGWYADWLGLTQTEDTVFQPEKTYYWIAQVKLGEDYIFAEDYAGTLTINGEAVVSQTDMEFATAVANGEPIRRWGADGDVMTIVLSFEIDPLEMPEPTAAPEPTVAPEPEKPTVKLSADAKSARVTGDFSGLYARVALVIDINGVSGLYVTQATINESGEIVIPSFMIPGLTVKGVSVALGLV